MIYSSTLANMRIGLCVGLALVLGVCFCLAEGGDRHTNNWAVIVCASRYWFNYRVSVRAVEPTLIQ